MSGINVRGIIRSGITSLNPDVEIVIVRQQGYTVNPDGSQSPTQLPPEKAVAQIQPIPSSQLTKSNNYNTSKVYSTVYLNGNYNSLKRGTENEGGDLFYFDNYEWKVFMEPEKYLQGLFPWTKVEVIRLKQATAPVVL